MDAVRQWQAASGIAEGPLFRRLSRAGNVIGDRPLAPPGDVAQLEPIAAGVKRARHRGGRIERLQTTYRHEF